MGSLIESPELKHVVVGGASWKERSESVDVQAWCCCGLATRSPRDEDHKKGWIEDRGSKRTYRRIPPSSADDGHTVAIGIGFGTPFGVGVVRSCSN